MIPSSRVFARASRRLTASGWSASCCSARARGEARPNSDYDVAVFVRDLADRREEVDRIVSLVTDIIDDSGAVIHAMPYRAGSYEDRTSLMREIRRDGFDV
ncbi:MAG TPA: hypothetical protein VHY79_19545 [Rhizomicrobium sp.]|jgi:predicted nucleotidyltransferase|nr:hypothetical protein [Rhizomicrobium sp.]